MTALAGSRAAERIEAAMDATPEPVAAPEPAAAPVEDEPEPVGAESPFYVREWRGAPLYACPALDARGEPDFHGRSHRSIIRHIIEVHDEPERTIETRARQAGIVLARR